MTIVAGETPAFLLNTKRPDYYRIQYKKEKTMTKHSLLILFFCSAIFIFFGSLISAQEQRTWSDATGKFKVEAKLHRIEGDKILLEKQDGKISSIPLSKLSKNDQEYVASQKDNPFADEDEASPFANEDHAKSNAGFDIEPKPLTGKNSIVFVGATNTSWNCPPDSDTTPAFKEKPPAIQFGIGALPLGARTEYQTYPYFANGKHYVLATVSIELSRHSASSRTSRSSANRNKRDGNESEAEGNETRFIFCNLETGDTRSESVPQKLTLLDVSPDGTAALFRSNVWGFSDTGTKAILYIADITSQKVNVLNAYTPFDEERFESNRDIKDAFVINKDTVLVLSQNTTLVVFNVKTGRVIWKTERTANTPVLSANRKYCIANGSVLETATGKSIGKPDIQERNGTYSFSPDGKFIAFTTVDGITFFDAETGKGSEPFFAGNTIGKHIWTGNQFVLAGRGLIDAKTKLLVWEYNPPEFYFGGYTWYLPSSGNRADKTLVPVMLPHPAAATNALKPEWAVAPGKEVALKIDDSVSEKNREIADHLEKVLKDNGIRIRDNAPITVEASIKKEKETSVFYVTGRGFGPPLMSPFARSGDEGTEIKYIPEVFSVQVKQGNKIYWQTSKTKAPPHNIPLDDIKKSSIQEVVKREMNKIKYADWFLQVIIPKQIPGGNIGHSMISATGIKDFKSGIEKPQTVVIPRQE
jgi:hypothetical protein